MSSFSHVQTLHLEPLSSCWKCGPYDSFREDVPRINLLSGSVPILPSVLQNSRSGGKLSRRHHLKVPLTPSGFCRTFGTVTQWEFTSASSVATLKASLVFSFLWLCYDSSSYRFLYHESRWDSLGFWTLMGSVSHHPFTHCLLLSMSPSHPVLCPLTLPFLFSLLLSLSSTLLILSSNGSSGLLILCFVGYRLLRF